MYPLLTFKLSCMAVVLSMQLQRIRIYQHAFIPFEKKPFNCALCMGFWIGVLFSLFHFHLSINCFTLPFVTAFISETLSRLFKLIPITL